jgi:hypothetical protein
LPATFSMRSEPAALTAETHASRLATAILQPASHARPPSYSEKRLTGSRSSYLGWLRCIETCLSQERVPLLLRQLPSPSSTVPKVVLRATAALRMTHSTADPGPNRECLTQSPSPGHLPPVRPRH